MKNRKRNSRMRTGYSMRVRFRQKMNPKIVVTVVSGILVFTAFFIYSNFFNSEKAYAAVNYSWNGSTDSSWTNDLNWTPNGIPGSADNVTIGSMSTRNPILISSISLNNLTINSGAVLDLKGFDLTTDGIMTMNAGSTLDLTGSKLTTNGNAIFNGGSILDNDTLGSLYAMGSTTTFGVGLIGPTFDVLVHVKSATIRIANSTFNNNTAFYKTGTSNDQSVGNNTFNDEVSITTLSSGYLLMAATNNDIFNSDATFSSLGNGIVYIAYRGTGTAFNGNVIVNSTGTGGVRIGASTGTSELASTKKILIGAQGFDNGMLMLANMNIPSTDSTYLSLAGNAVLTLGPGATFAGDVVADAGGICLSGATFNSSAIITKNGTSNDRGAGRNLFNGPTSIINTGTGYLLMCNNYPDTFNTEVTFSSMNSGLIYPCYNGSGSVFNENIIVNSTVGGGVRIGASSGTSTIANTKRVIVGSEGFDAGTLILGNFTSEDTSSFALSLSGSSTLTLGPNSSFAGDFTADAGGFFLNGVTMNKSSSFTKTGTTNDQGTGSNIFNGPTSFVNEGTGYFLMCSSQNDIFNDEVTFSSKNSGIIYSAYRGTGTQFNDNIIINSTSTGGVRIGASTGTSVLAAGKQIIVGSDGFSSGTLILGNFTSASTTEQVIDLTGSAVLTLGPASTFEGDLVTTSGGLSLNGTTFNGKAKLTKTGSTNDQGTGNNIFNDTVTITNEGSGYVLMSNTTRDIYNYPASFNSIGNGIVYVAYRGVDTEFNDNVLINSTGGGGVRIGASTGTSRITAGKSIQVGSQGFSGGTFMLANFTSPGTDPQDFSLTGSSILSIGPSTYFAGDLTATSGGLCFNGVTVDGVSNFTKTGTSSDQGTGNNIFNDSVTITNQGSGYVLMSSSTRDVFNSHAGFNSLGNGIIYVAYRGTDTEFNDNVTINSTGGGGIRIGASTGTSRIAAGKNINVGSIGFSGGLFMLANYTSPGTSPQNFNFTGSGILTLGPSTSFAGDVNAECGGICLSGVIIDGASTFIKTGTSNDQGTGNNIFTGPTSITNTGTGYILLSSSKKDIYQSEVNYTITNSGIIYVSYNGIDNEFNGDIYLNSTGLGSIRFGSSTGTSKLAPTKKVNIGSFGFSGGYVQFNKFIQDGGTPQVLDVSTGNAAIYFNSGSVFDGVVNIRFPQVYLNGSVFNGATNIEKTGPGNNAGTGGNTFNGLTTIKNSGTGVLYLANSSGDDFNNHANFIQTGSGALRPAHIGTSTFSGDISTLGSTAAITFAASSGTVALDGGVLQNINGSSVYAPIFRRLNVSNGGAGVKLNVPVSVNAALTLTNGLVETTNTNILSIENGVSSVSGGSPTSYVNGPIRKVGTQSFTFPTGKGGIYRPIGMSAPTGTTTSFTAEYFKSDPGLLYNALSLVLTLKQISRCEYWTLQRTVGTSNVNVTLSWNTGTCAVGTPSDVKVAAWDPLLSIWKDFGSTASTGNASIGSITSGSLVSSFGAFTFSSTNASVSLPVELTNFTAEIVNDRTLVSWQTASEINNDYFTVERSADGQYFEALGTVGGSGNTTNANSYNYTDEYPLGGTSFYRLRQTDYDGKFEIFEPVSVNFKGMNSEFRVESVGPNPFSNNIRIDYFSPDNSELTLMLSGLDGSLAYTSRISTNAGSGTFSTGQLPDLSSGVYILKLLKGDAILETRKLVRN